MNEIWIVSGILGLVAGYVTSTYFFGKSLGALVVMFLGWTVVFGLFVTPWLMNSGISSVTQETLTPPVTTTAPSQPTESVHPMWDVMRDSSHDFTGDGTYLATSGTASSSLIVYSTTYDEATHTYSVWMTRTNDDWTGSSDPYAYIAWKPHRIDNVSSEENSYPLYVYVKVPTFVAVDDSFTYSIVDKTSDGYWNIEGEFGDSISSGTVSGSKVKTTPLSGEANTFLYINQYNYKPSDSYIYKATITFNADSIKKLQTKKQTQNIIFEFRNQYGEVCDRFTVSVIKYATS